MPEDMQAHSQLYGVEIDSLSGRIAQALYPDADIAIQGFEQNRFQNGCFDVAVGNVPFGELGFRDTVHDTTKLHDFFFAEALDKLKNGGIMAFVTSAGTLDKRDESTRQMLADKADFIGAIRLPGGKNGAFKDNAGTEVTTDIIFLQKREGKSVAEMSDIPDWVHIGETADGLPINKYFEQHPDMVLGTVVEGNKLYGSGTMVVAEDGFDLRSALHEAVGKLSAEISHERGRDVYAKTADGVQVQIPSKLRNYSFFLSDDAKKIGTAMSPDTEIVKSLDADWILSPSSLRGDLQPKYAAIGTKSIFLNLKSVEGMYQSIDELGELFDREEQAQALIDEYEAFMNEYKEKNANKEKPTVLVLMGLPGSYIVATENSYVGSLVKLAGGINVYQGETDVFLNANTEDMQKRDPDIIVRCVHALPDDVVEMFKEEFETNDIWKHFRAVEEGKVYDLSY